MRYLILIVLGLWAGCRGGGAAQEAADGVARLTYWCAPNPQEIALARHLTEAWNRDHPDVQVRVQPIPAGQSSEEVLLAAIVARTTPDLCSNIWPGITQDFVRGGGLLPLDGFAGFDSLLASRIPDELAARFRSPDGRYYQIPWKTNPIMMQYNKRLFREAGVAEPPRTYGAYLAAAEKLTQDINGDGQTDRWIGYRDVQPIWWQRYFDYYAFYIGASGGQTLFRGDEVQIDTAASNRVFGFFQALYAGRYFPITKFQGSPFLAERIATEFTGPWNIAWLEENAPEGFEYGFAPLPLPDDYTGPAYTYGDYKNIVVFSTTRHPEAAWRFAAYLVSPEADRLLLEMTRQIPVRKDLLTDPAFTGFFADHPDLRLFAEQAPRTRGVDGVSDLKEILDAIAQQFEAAAVYGVRTPAEATARAIQRIRVIRDWNS